MAEVEGGNPRERVIVNVVAALAGVAVGLALGHMVWGAWIWNVANACS